MKGCVTYHEGDTMIQRTVLSPEDVDQMIKDHALWQKTGYRAGQQADFSNCDLSGIAIVCHGREPLFLLEHVNFQNADLGRYYDVLG